MNLFSLQRNNYYNLKISLFKIILLSIINIEETFLKKVIVYKCDKINACLADATSVVSAFLLL